MHLKKDLAFYTSFAPICLPTRALQAWPIPTNDYEETAMKFMNIIIAACSTTPKNAAINESISKPKNSSIIDNIFGSPIER